MERQFTASDVCLIAGCPASTLRAWRNRNGLFPHLSGGGGWTRYDLAEALAVRVVTLLSERGFSADHAVTLANEMREAFIAAIQGYAPWIAVGRKLKWQSGEITIPPNEHWLELVGHPGNEISEQLEFRDLGLLATRTSEIDGLSDPMPMLINLNYLTNEVWMRAKDLAEARP